MREELDGLLACVDNRDPVTIRLTFNGKPVVASHGIAGDFGSKAVGRFVDAVSAVAASLQAPLSAMGPILGRDQSQLLITGTAIGSFGFVLEEASPPSSSIDDAPSIAAQALAQTQALLEGSLSGDDDLLADAASALDPRAIAKVRDFVQCLADHESVCSLEVDRHGFRFTDLDQVRKSARRLGTEHLHEREITLEGRFIGALPNRRTFEFATSQAGSTEVIAGKIAQALEAASAINEHLDVPAVATFHVVQVGAGRPRQTLSAMPRWASGEEVPT